MENKLEMDIPFARKVLEFAENTHDDFTHEQLYFHSVDSCGTSACLAGITCMLHPEVEMSLTTFHGPSLRGVRLGYEEIGELLGLDPEQTRSLFFNFSNASAIKQLRGYIEEAEKEQAGRE